jgi:hypothetical protein
MGIGAIRDAAWAVAAFLLVAIFTAYISANVRQLAAYLKWDSHFLRLWRGIEKLSQCKLREKWWLWLCLGASAGLAMSLSFLPATETVPLTSKQTARLRIQYPHNSVVTEIIQNENIYKQYSLAMVGNGSTAQDQTFAFDLRGRIRRHTRLKITLRVT